MVYNILFLDIDGTLLNSRHQLTPAVQSAVSELWNRRGIPVVLISARIIAAVEPLCRELLLDCPCVSYTGALITHGDQILLSKTFSRNDARSILETAGHAVSVSVFRGDFWFVEREDKWTDQESVITRLSPRVTDLTSLLWDWEAEKSDPHKIMLMGEEAAIDRLEPVLKQQLPHLGIHRSKPTYLEITSGEVSKPSAMAFLCQRYGIPKEESIAVGDSWNDAAMIEFAGLGIAMGNAPDDIKKLARHVTATNDEDGVARVIEQFFSF